MRNGTFERGKEKEKCMCKRQISSNLQSVIPSPISHHHKSACLYISTKPTDHRPYPLRVQGIVNPWYLSVSIHPHHSFQPRPHGGTYRFLRDLVILSLSLSSLSSSWVILYMYMLVDLIDNSSPGRRRMDTHLHPMSLLLYSTHSQLGTPTQDCH